MAMLCAIIKWKLVKKTHLFYRVHRSNFKKTHAFCQSGFNLNTTHYKIQNAEKKHT